MTFLQSTVSLAHGLRAAPLQEASHEDIDTEHEQDLAQPEARATGDSIPLRLYGFAALSGAAAAALVGLVLAVYPLRVNNDPRVDQLIADTSAVRSSVQTLTDKVRGLETEGVATSQASDMLTGQLKTTTGEVDAIKATLTALVVEQQNGKDLLANAGAPALFGVAVVQLRDRMEAGLPFDWELVNLRGIVGSEPALLAELDRLAPLSHTGVATHDRLLAMMQVLIARAGNGESLVQASLGAISRVLGPNLVNPPAGDPTVLSRAYGRLVVGDLANYLREMQGLTLPSANAARPVVEAAQQRLAALQSVQDLLRSARTGLQKQLRAVTTPATTQQ
jgi:hypothetical protein